MKKDAAKFGSAPGLSVAGWPLRRKLALALAVPLMLAAVLGFLRVQSALSESANASASSTQVTVLPAAVDYLRAAENAMVAAQSDDQRSQGDLIDAMQDLATAASDLDKAAEAADLTDLQQAHVDALLDLSQSMRDSEARSLGPDTWIAQVRQLESGVTQLITALQSTQAVPETRLEQLSQALGGRLSLALQQALVAKQGGTSTDQAIYSELGVEAAAIDRLAAGIEKSQDQVAALRSANTIHAATAASGGTDLGGRDAYIPYDEITETLLTDVEKALGDRASSARSEAIVSAILTLLALVAAVLLALMVAKLLLDPISRVREGALAVARHKLPDAVARIRAGEEPEEIKPIDVDTEEEIGQMARAVDDLHRQAIHLASGEAQLRQTVNAMFVTLSRRSNSLVNQQLAQIERLEQDEEDPKRLESLFRLDHLASRMRRTADSLLILADAPNRAAGQFSLTVGESLQAATSGVQEYQRVHIMSHLGTRINEDASADVVHLLTELVDNALSFSPPSEPVRLNATMGPAGATITVTDSGLGMPQSELDQANEDLASGAKATPDTARRMGLFVVSRLAERHGIQAKLERNPRGTGITATIVLPAAILPDVAGSATVPTTPAFEKPAPAAPTETPSVRREDLGVTVDEPVTPPAAPAAPAARVSEPTPDRPPLGDLGGLLPKREPGANMPLTGADAFLPPETSGATGPLFGKKKETTEEPEAEAEKPSMAERVASVVPITALAARQRAAAEEDAKAAEEAARAAAAAQEAEATVEEPAAEPVVDETPAVEEAVTETAEIDPLSAPWQDPEAATSDDAVSDEPVVEEPVAVEEPVIEEPVIEDPVEAPVAAEPEIVVSEEDPLGLDTPAVVEPAVEEPVADTTVVEEPVAAPEPVVEEPAAEAPSFPAAPASPAARETLTDSSPTPARAGDSPIFKSMRSGWLAGEGEGEWHQTEVEKGWEIAEHVAEEAPAAESTSAGLPMRQPGERLVPGSVATPTAGKTRDPEAIRRRLSAHTAGVRRGRQATTNSTQHTEAGPA